MTTWLVGAYGPDMDGAARGIRRLLPQADGSLELDSDWLIEAPSPAFLARSGDTLFAALEGQGTVARIVPGGATVDHSIASGGTWPCHIGVYGETIVVANYFDGTLGVTDTELAALEVVHPPAGSGPHSAQEGPHAHSTLLIAPGILVSADLGADRIHVHRLEGGRLTRSDSVALRPGFGPRDLLLLGADGPMPLLYVLGEHGLSVIVARWTGQSLEILSDTALPGAAAADQASALGAHDGRLYAGLRGSNQVAALDIVGDTLEPIASVSSAGDWPRHLVVDGPLLHVANQQSDSVASFSLGSDGIPSLIAEPVTVASPTYLLAD